MSHQDTYPRDMRGYGAHPPHPQWPGDARVAVQFVLNYEEGGESCVLHGDEHSETFLSDIIGAQPYPDRHMSMESLYEYGSRAGVWRILREFRRRRLPLTVFGVTQALARNPEVVRAMLDDGHEIACHGLRWIHYQSMSEWEERRHIQAAIQQHTELTGAPPAGWYTGRDSPNTRSPGGGAGRFRIRQRLLRRRSAVLDLRRNLQRRAPPAPGDSLHPGSQRHALHHAPGVQQR